MSLILILFPLLMAAVISFAEDTNAKRSLALVSSVLSFVGSFFVSVGPAVQLGWLDGLGISLAFSGEGASSLLVIVVALVMMPTIYYAARHIETRTGSFLVMLLLLQTGLNGLFLAKDLVVFYIFFELSLLPSLAMLAVWGRAQRREASQRYMLYAITGSFIMLVSILAIKPLSGAASYHIDDLLRVRNALPLSTQIWLLLGFSASFAVKLPMVPLHAWLPDFHEQNHPSGVADVAGTLYKVGGFGFFAWALPLLPEAARLLAPIYIALAALTAIYAAWIAIGQKDLKRLLAYASLSHMGIVGVGVFSLHAVGLSGAMYLLAAQMVSTSALFLMSGMLYARKGSFALDSYSGMAVHAPKLAAFSLLSIFASIGVPGLANFPGEFMSLLGAFQNSMWLGSMAMLAVIAAGVYGVTLYQKLYQEEPRGTVEDLNLTETITIAPLVVMMLFLGIFPAVGTRTIEPQALAAAQLGVPHSSAVHYLPADAVRHDPSMMPLPTVFVEPFVREDATGHLQPHYPRLDLERIPQGNAVGNTPAEGAPVDTIANFPTAHYGAPIALEPIMQADGRLELVPANPFPPSSSTEPGAP